MGAGSHGSLTKAGKVRDLSKRIPHEQRIVNKPVRVKGEITGSVKVVRHHKHKHACPRVAKGRLAYLRTDNDGCLARKGGQRY